MAQHTRRARQGSGSVEDLGGGRWRLYMSLGTDPVTGNRRRHTKIVQASSKRGAQEQMNKLLTDRHGRREQITLGQLLDEYVEARPDMSPSTRVELDGYLRRHLPDRLRRKRLSAVTARDLDTLYLHLRREGGHAGGPLATSTVKRLHGILHAALEQAVRWDYVAANAADRTARLDVEHHEVVLPPAEHLVRLLAGIDELAADAPNAGGSPLPDFTALLLATGARPGELCALPWGDVDLEAAVDETGRPIGRLTIDQSVARAKGGAVVKTTKTNRGRGVYIDPDVTAVLAARLVRWRPAVLVAGVPLGQFPVFPSKGRGERPWRPDSMGREFRTVRDRLQLSDDLTLRNLRHYCVSVLAAAGVDVVTIAKRMGHSPQIMLGVYAHLFAQGDIAAASQLGAHNAGLRGAR